MPVITLTTDWGTADYFAGALKGDILSAFDKAVIVDITHEISKHNQVNGAFVLKNAWPRFPAGSVHIVGIHGAGEIPPRLIVISHDGHYFLGPDDGFFSLVFDEDPSNIYYIKNAGGQSVPATSKLMAASAAYLVQGGNIGNMGEQVTEYTRKSMLRATIEENTIKGSVIYIDSFGNLVTNITRHLLDRVSRGREYEIILRKSEYSINRVSDNYLEAGMGNLLALFNDAGYLEIAISNGHASGLLNMKYGEIVRIEFK